MQELVPIPSGETLDEISRALLERLDARVDETRFAVEHAQMLSLPSHAFDARTIRPASVSRRSLVVIEGAYYSMPCEWNGLEVMARIGAGDIEFVGPTGKVVHPRKRFGERSIDYRHYLRELARKPQALRQVAPELMRDLGEPFSTAWSALVDAHGPRQASRIFAKVLGHVETRGFVAVARVVAEALARGESLLLALAPPAAHEAKLDGESLPTCLRSVEVAQASAADYDALLGTGGAR